jgi:hypothetical protein
MYIQEGLQQLLQEDPFLLLLGMGVLIATPPLVGVAFWATVFQGRVNNIGEFMRRVVLGLVAAFITAVALVWVGSYLFQPSTIESLFAITIFFLLISLIGIGWLEW